MPSLLLYEQQPCGRLQCLCLQPGNHRQGQYDAQALDSRQRHPYHPSRGRSGHHRLQLPAPAHRHGKDRFGGVCRNLPRWRAFPRLRLRRQTEGLLARSDRRKPLHQPFRHRREASRERIERLHLRRTWRVASGRHATHLLHPGRQGEAHPRHASRHAGGVQSAWAIPQQTRLHARTERLPHLPGPHPCG